MQIRVLGAHNVESATTRLTTLLIDDVLAVDTGSLTSSLSLQEQEKVSSILLTHCHYDHIRDIAAIALNISYFRKTIRVYSMANTLDVINNHILNNVIYPRFTEIPTPDNPPLRFCALEPYEVEDVDRYKVLAIPVQHSTSSVGYQIISEEGKSVFYSGDTGPGLSRCWAHISPQLLITEVTLPNRLGQHSVSTNHLTPRLLAEELTEFKRAKGHLPQVVVIHLAPLFEDEIRKDVEQLSEEMGISITVGYEGMELNL